MSIKGASQYQYFIKEGDLEPPIEAYLQYADGTAINVTGKTVNFKWRLRDNDLATLNSGAATVVDGPTGHVKYDWQTAETNVPGAYYGEFEVTISAGRTITFPNTGYIDFLIVGELTGGP